MAVVGTALTFGIANDELSSLATQKVTLTKKVDKKEARNKSGVVIAVSYYNKTSEVKIEALGTSAATIGASIALTGVDPDGTLQFLEELSTDYSNEDFVKFSATIMGYEGI